MSSLNPASLSWGKQKQKEKTMTRKECLDWMKKYIWVILFVITLITAIVVVAYYKFWADPSKGQPKTERGSASSTAVESASPEDEARAFWSDPSTNANKRVMHADGVVTHLVKLENGGARATIHGAVIQPDWVTGPYEGIIIPTHTIGGRVGVHPSSTMDEPPTGVVFPEPYRLQYVWEQITATTKRLLGDHEETYNMLPGQIWVGRPTFKSDKPKLQEVKPKK